jgi:hypothetical protein
MNTIKKYKKEFSALKIYEEDLENPDPCTRNIAFLSNDRQVDFQGTKRNMPDKFGSVLNLK